LEQVQNTLRENGLENFIEPVGKMIEKAEKTIMVVA